MISLLAFPKSEFPTLEKVEEVISAHFDNLVELQRDEERETIEVQVGTERALVAPKRPAMPWGLLERPCKNAWYWPEAIEVMQDHAWHMVVLLKESKSDPCEKSLLLTRLTAVLGEGLGYLGVYWDSATMVHSAAAFSAAAKEMSTKELPANLWISFRIVENDDATHTLFTTGLDALGHMEIEVPASTADPTTLEGWAYNVAHYLLKDGEKIEDGESVGRSDEEKVTVRHVPSMFDSARKVMFLEL
ncbi:MAG: DUF4261 domain-containing protein [Planctomycetota bacterium]